MTSGRSPAAREAVAIALLMFVFLRVSLPQVFLAPASADDLTWVTRALVPWWYSEPRSLDTDPAANGYHNSYYYCVHHPTVARIVYRQALHWYGVTEPPAKRYDYFASREENELRGNLIDARVRELLRLVNLAFACGGVLFLYLALRAILRNRLLALVGTLPICLEPTLIDGPHSVVPYLGADAILFFWTALFLYALLRFVRRPVSAGVVLGLLAGLAASTKITGALLLLVGVTYFLIWGRGRGRLIPVAIMAVIAPAVFLALNPVYFGGGTAWAAKVFRDTFAVMAALKDVTTQTRWGAFTRTEVVMSMLPHVVLLLPAAAVAAVARRAWWFAPTLLWGLFLIVPHLAGVYLFFPRYAFVVRLGFLLPVVACALWCAKHKKERDIAAVSGEALRKDAVGDTCDDEEAATRRPAEVTSITLWLIIAAEVILAAANLVPLVVLLALAVFMLLWGAMLSLQGSTLGVVAVLPLVLILPWTVSIKSAMEMAAFSAAAATLWVVWLYIAKGGKARGALRIMAALAVLAAALSAPSLILAAVVALYGVVVTRRGLLPLVLALVILPLAVAIALDVANYGASLDTVGGFVAKLNPARPVLWNVPSWSRSVHGRPYDNNTMVYNQWFYWPMLLPLGVVAWYCRRERWFVPTFLWGVMLAAGALAFTREPYFQYSLPLEMGLLVPVGVASIVVLGRAMGVEVKGFPCILRRLLPGSRGDDGNHSRVKEGST